MKRDTYHHRDAEENAGVFDLEEFIFCVIGVAWNQELLVAIGSGRRLLGWARAQEGGLALLGPVELAARDAESANVDDGLADWVTHPGLLTRPVGFPTVGFASVGLTDD